MITPTVLVLAGQDDQEAYKQAFAYIEGALWNLTHCRTQRSRPGDVLPLASLVQEIAEKVLTQSSSVSTRVIFYLIAGQVVRKYISRHIDDGDQALTSSVQVQCPDVVNRIVHATLDELEKVHRRSYQQVMLRYFCGLDRETTMWLLQLDAQTLRKDWKFANTYLRT